MQARINLTPSSLDDFLLSRIVIHANVKFVMRHTGAIINMNHHDTKNNSGKHAPNIPMFANIEIATVAILSSFLIFNT